MYGTPRVSSRPWTVPSSPPAPCTATNAAPKPPSASAPASSRSRSRPTGSWPSERSAASIRRPSAGRRSARATSRPAGRRPSRPARARPTERGRRPARALLAGRADAAHALAQGVLVDRREVQPQRAARPGRRGSGPAGHEGHVVRQAAGQEVAGVERRAAWPTGTGRPRAAPRRSRAAGARPSASHRASRRRVDARRPSTSSLERSSQEGQRQPLRQRRGAQVGGLLGQVQLGQDRVVRGDPAEPQARREDLRERAEVDHAAVGVEALAASAGPRPRSAARRTGRPPPPARRAGRRPRAARSGAPAERPAVGFWNVGMT